MYLLLFLALLALGLLLLRTIVLSAVGLVDLGGAGLDLLLLLVLGLLGLFGGLQLGGDSTIKKVVVWFQLQTLALDSILIGSVRNLNKFLLKPKLFLLNGIPAPSASPPPIRGSPWSAPDRG